MRISIFGMGYVGCVSAACLASSGHEVVGVDVSPDKLSLIASGKSPIVEPEMDDLVATQVAENRLRVTEDIDDAIAGSECSLVCVGTPSRRNGSLDLAYVMAVCRQIGTALRDKPGLHVVVIRSTMLPGSVREIVVPALESASGRSEGDGFAVAINPEFLREGTAVRDYREPPFTLIGTDDARALAVIKELYADIRAPVLETGVREAEMVKYTCNVFHALKVSFANEIGNLCKAAGIDSHVVMDAFCQDTKLNLSPYYLKPGFAFGGSCLPKDLRAINYKARELDVSTPVLDAILPSNERQVAIAFDRVMAADTKKVALLGLSFKAGTDDLRESPMVALAERLIGKGYTLQLFDREVEMARLTGANRRYIDAEIPHLSVLLNSSLDQTITESDLIIVCKNDSDYADALNRLAEGRTIVDLVRLTGINADLPGYDGLCW